jgi:DNA-binding NarL/FixJ family response regulator
MVKVLLADDHTLIRDGLKKILESESDIRVIGEAANGVEAIQMVKQLQPDLMLIDIRMPVMDGLEAISTLRQEKNLTTRMLVLSMYAQEDYILESAKSGASGYILKDASREELLTAIRTIHAGQKYFSGSISNVLVDNYLLNLHKAQKAENKYHLTKTEKKILKLILRDFSNTQIADELSISIRTVETHRFNIMKKLGVNKSRDLVSKAIKERVI